MRSAHLDGAVFPPGKPFHFGVNVFDSTAESWIVNALESLELGPTRVRLRSMNDEEVKIDLAQTFPVQSMTVRFLTPTELKGGSVPTFGLLSARIRDRVSSLSQLYANTPSSIDFRAFADKAAQIEMTACETNYVDVQRRSSRTGQVHSIGGFVGFAQYQGDLGEFVSHFRAATYTGVGRQTTWGKGQISIEY